MQIKVKLFLYLNTRISQWHTSMGIRQAFQTSTLVEMSFLLHALAVSFPDKCGEGECYQ
jgi:hypothetical protein